MSHMCPLCNGFYQFHFRCSKCGHHTEEAGRVMDYFDDYSAYMEIDQLKQEDGISVTFLEHQCAHLFYCPMCHYEEVKLITE